MDDFQKTSNKFLLWESERHFKQGWHKLVGDMLVLSLELHRS
jgi:hypothetical protein